MTTPGTQDRPKPILRTTEATANRIRALAGRMSDLRGGSRVTHDDLIAALADMGERRPEDLLALLDAPK